jgi:hypothetical protein
MVVVGAGSANAAAAGPSALPSERFTQSEPPGTSDIRFSFVKKRP